jgi:hypothetical protein
MADRWSKLGTLSLGVIGVLMLFGAVLTADATAEECASGYTLGCALGPYLASGMAILGVLHFFLAVGVWKRWGWVVLIGIVVASLGLLFGVMMIGEEEWLFPGSVVVAGYVVSLAAMLKMAWDAYEQSYRAA